MHVGSSSYVAAGYAAAAVASVEYTSQLFGELASCMQSAYAYVLLELNDVYAHRLVYVPVSVQAEGARNQAHCALTSR